MYQVGRVPDHVHRSHKEHNRWMYVAPVREKIMLWDVLDKLIIALSFAVIAFSVALIVVIPLIG